MLNKQFGTKAATLESLANVAGSFRVPPLVRFTVDQWGRLPDDILDEIHSRFADGLLAVRSSSHIEDTAGSSQAGSFDSILGVKADHRDSIRSAIDSVVSSYSAGSRRHGDVSRDEVFVQELVTDIDAAGVILTHCVDDGSPYYVFSYDDESGASDTVTSGRGDHKTVRLYRNARPEHCDSLRLRRMLELARELEALFDSQPLDIEFALDRSERMNLLQVRPISSVRDWQPDADYLVERAIPQIEEFVRELNKRQPSILGERTVLGNMPDWNPAELIGVTPPPLAASLFRSLISHRVWHQARESMGYRKLPPTELMVLVAGHAMIDVRASLNSFLPATLQDSVGEKLVNHWLTKLCDKPFLHDKIEFELVPTALDFSFRQLLEEEYQDVLTAAERAHWLQELTLMSRALVTTEPGSSLEVAEAQISHAASKSICDRTDVIGPNASVARIASLLDDGRFTAHAFAVLARHAFIAEAILRSIVQRGAVSGERIGEFKSSITTVMSEFSDATKAVSAGQMDEQQFLEKYGHLRPGSFDLQSPCYRNRPSLFSIGLSGAEPVVDRRPFTLTESEVTDIRSLLSEEELDQRLEPTTLLEYAKRAIVGREYGKFVFTRYLSEVLEEIALWGRCHRLGRDELSYLQVEEILETRHRNSRVPCAANLTQKIDQARMDRAQASVVKLSYLIRGVRDVNVVPVHRSQPTFITQRRVEAPLIRLSPTSVGVGDMSGCIVCIENADPGFDWIFTSGIVGLVTQYGGANSHMAIRCAELQLPAAIGCGEDIFQQLNQSNRVLLDCASNRVELS